MRTRGDDSTNGSAAINDLLTPGAKVEKLAGGMKFLEGPVWKRDGYLLFSDQKQDKMLRWSPKDGVSVFREKGNGCNGNFLDNDGLLITCEGILRRMTRTGRDGTIEVLTDRCDGKRFNSPNDVVVKSDGTIWFSDPPYWLPKDQAKEMDGNYVFCFDPKTKLTRRVADGFEMPNGLCFSPDEKKLYIADSGKAHHVRIFDVNADNTLAGGAVFCTIEPGVPDGMRIDERGNLWSSAGDGVQIFSPDAKLIGKIAVPESPANLCFGGEGGTQLFICARTSLYTIQTKVRDARAAR